jgi:dipeptidyl aminopeptidase/acylaminoacyl peptidase
MKKNNLFLILLIISVPGAYCQRNDLPTNEARYQSYLKFHMLLRGGYVRPHWFADGNRFWFNAGLLESPVICAIDPRRNTRSILAKAPQEAAISRSKLFSPDRQRFIFVEEDNLWLGDSANPKKQRLTDDGNKDYTWSIPTSAWSPDGTKLFVKRADDRKVHHLPVINYSKPLEEVEWTVYPKVGGALEIPELFVLDITTKRQVKIDMGNEPEQYIFPLGWRPDGSEVIFMRMNRQGNKLELLAADPASGTSRSILVEQQKTFVCGLDFYLQKWARQFTLLKDGNTFIWMSERDGWKHLYLYDMNGKLIRRLTEGTFPVTEVIKADEKTGWVYFTASAESNLYYTNLYRVNFEGKKFKKLTEAGGRHTIQFSPSGEYFLDAHSSMDRAPSVELRSADGRLIRVLSTTDTSRLNSIGWRPPESFVVKAADSNTDLYGILYKPFDFDPNKKYPVIEFIYGGPFMTVVPNGFVPNTTLSEQAQALAQLGYITFLVDGRGTPERSKAFQDAVYGNIGKYEIPDHTAALQQLAEKRPYMDLKRVGIYGHSWGGYFALRAMLMAPDIYRAGIASAPGDLTEGAEVNEPYMGLLQDNKAGYEFGTNTNFAANLKGKLLFIHGTSDINAPLSATIRMIDALINAGKPYDLVLLPQQTHFLEGAGQKYSNEAVRRFFDKNLKE